MNDGSMINKERTGVLWDLTAFFPYFNSPGFIEYRQALRCDVEQLLGEMHEIGNLNRKTMASWEKLILRWETLMVRMGHFSTYIDLLSATDSANEEFAKEQADYDRLCAAFDTFGVILGHVLNSAATGMLDSFLKRIRLRDIFHALNRICRQAQFRMTAEKEALAADLNVTGFKAWENLYNTLSGKLTFTLELPDGRSQTLPVSSLRGLLADPDHRVRQAAFDGGSQAWSSVEDVCGAALNAISGTRLTLQRYRKVDHFLDTALFLAGIDKRTLDAMYEAVYEKLDIVKNVYRIRSRFSDRKGIWFHEREASLPLNNAEAVSWREAVYMVQSALSATYPAMADYFSAMLKNRWIDSQPRSGKRPGAFCANSRLIGEQRVFMSFTGALRDVTTLAHEVGHAWHGHLLKQRRPLSQRYPMTLAETASGFAEQLVFQSLMDNPRLDPFQKLRLLDTDLSGTAVLLLDITTRFEFEKLLYAARKEGEVPVSRLKQMMAETQHRIFGDVLEPEGADPLFWASKLHFYMTNVEFYNFPYTFGFILARSLNRRFRMEGASFLPRYETFLSETGMDSVEKVVHRALNADIGSPAFWRDALEDLGLGVDLYSTLMASNSALLSESPKKDPSTQKAG